MHDLMGHLFPFMVSAGPESLNYIISSCVVPAGFLSVFKTARGPSDLIIQSNMLYLLFICLCVSQCSVLLYKAKAD